MAFEIKPGKSLARNLRRIVKSQARKASPPSAASGMDRSMRSSTRPGNGSDGCAPSPASPGRRSAKYSRRLNHRLRDAARPLGDLRDAKVMVKTLERSPNDGRSTIVRASSRCPSTPSRSGPRRCDAM